jgi:hypothetical protein
MILSVIHAKIRLTLAESFFGEIDILLAYKDFCILWNSEVHDVFTG